VTRNSAKPSPAGDTDAVPRTSTTLTSTCLCLVTRVTRDGEGQVLLGHKKTGLGRGKIVGLGGHVEPGEAPVEAAAREAKEESGVQVAGLTPAAHITFLFPARPEWDMTVDVFTTAEFSGEPGAGQ
jgi:8-oxo-dGTP diphosphatase